MTFLKRFRYSLLGVGLSTFAFAGCDKQVERDLSLSGLNSSNSNSSSTNHPATPNGGPGNNGSPPSVRLQNPGDNFVITKTNRPNFPFSGLCSEENSPVLILASTSLQTVATCSTGSFTGTIDLTTLPDGPVVISASQTNPQGITTDTRNGTLDTSIPTLTIDSHELLPTPSKSISVRNVPMAGADVVAYKAVVLTKTDCKPQALTAFKKI